MPAAKNNPPSADSKQRCQYQSCASRWSPSPKMLARQATSTSQQDREEAQYRKNAAQPKNLLTHPNSLPQSISKRFDLKTSRLTIAMCSLFFALTAAPLESRHFGELGNQLDVPVIVLIQFFANRRRVNHQVIRGIIEHRFKAHQNIL